MDKWTEYNPDHGVTETNEITEDGKVIVHKTQDVQSLLDRNKELANTKATDIGIKKGLWHYANIPLTVQYELLKKGINIARREDYRKLYDEINSNYPYLKTTSKTHSIGRNKQQKPETSTPRGPYVIVR
jgi:hypothetical protein